jgi:hypothetical protein
MVTASFFICLIFKPASGQTDTRLENDKIIINRPSETAITSTPNSEPNVRVSYDRFENTTWYEMKGLNLAPWNGKSDYSGLSPTLDMTVQFGCSGDSGESPCMPNQVVLNFSYTNFFSRGEYTYKYPPFDYQQRSVIAIADGKRIPLGFLNVSRNSDSRYVSVRGTLPVSIQAFRQLASARSVEMKVGILPVT